MLVLTRKLFGLATLAVAMVGTVAHADSKSAITKPAFDPSARKVEMFKAMEEGLIDVRLIQKTAKGGNLLFENKTKEPLTVQLPEAFVGVHVLNQGFGGGQQGGGLGGGQQGGGGGGQAVGGGGGQQGGGLGGGGQQGGGGGGGFFSIPPERIVRVAMKSVCLEYGKPEPNPRMEYKVYPVESLSKDPVLKEMLGFVSAGRASENVAQAAAWHLSNGMSWNELANIKQHRLGVAVQPPQFTTQEIMQAQALVATSKQRAVEKEEARTKSGESTAKIELPTRTPASPRP